MGYVCMGVSVVYMFRFKVKTVIQYDTLLGACSKHDCFMV